LGAKEALMKNVGWFFVATVLACGGGRTMNNNNKPTAGFKFTQSTARPQVFSFDAAESTASAATLAKYRWTFGDEAMGAMPSELTVATAQHAYKAAGDFTVTLIVVDDRDNASDPVSKMVHVPTVNTVGPMAVISGPMTAQPGMLLTFDGSASTPSGDIQNYAWDFGDSMTLAGKDKTIVQHTFAAANRYTVTLTVTDSLAQSHTAELQVQVGSAGPLAVCTYTPTTVTLGAPVSFSGSMSSVPTGSMIQAYVWDFGDGNTNIPGNATMGGAVQHTYNTSGTFKPKLKIFDNSSPPKSNESFCPDVNVGAAALCTGDYTWTLSGSGGGCDESATTITVTQMSNGMMTITEPCAPCGGPITYSGTWSGNTFSLNGTYSAQGIDYIATVHGTFSGCGSWTGAYHSEDTIIGFGCDSNISASKL
jgi:PKD repeat protein